MNIQKAYNQWAEQYDDNLNKTRELDIKVTQEVLSQYTFDSVLELGCGTGKNTEWLITRADKVIGIDFSERMLQKAKEKINHPNVTFFQADITRNWNLSSFEPQLICINLVLEHIQSLSPIFKQAQQTLAPNGLLFICELHPYKQYSGSKSKYETSEGWQELDTYIHHISEYITTAYMHHFQLVELKEWWDEGEESSDTPRLISMVFQTANTQQSL